MFMDNRDIAVLNKIYTETTIIFDFINGYDRNTFINDERLKRAVCMTLINIGELVKLLSDQTKELSPSIPWKQVAGLRDVTAHGYQTLRMEDIWETVITDVPKLQTQIQKLLSNFAKE